MNKIKFDFNPLDRIYVTQRFGEWPEHYKKYGLAGHNGIDLRTKFPDSLDGKRPVYAVKSGTILIAQSRDLGGYGKFIKIKHPDNSESVYGHLNTLKVRTRQIVVAGTLIGYSDNSGDSTGPHLHFGYKPAKYNLGNGYSGYIDPIEFFI